MAQDGVELAEFLRKTLQKDKIVLVGHSWGSIFGLFMVKARPDLFYAFVGTGRIADPTRNYAVAYDDLLKKAQRLGDPDGGIALSRYEAAGELERWFDYLAERGDAHDIVQGVVIAVTDLFLSSDDDIRRAIETGFLEHVMEQRTLRHWFSHWAYDDRQTALEAQMLERRDDIAPAQALTHVDRQALAREQIEYGQGSKASTVS